MTRNDASVSTAQFREYMHDASRARGNRRVDIEGRGEMTGRERDVAGVRQMYQYLDAHLTLDVLYYFGPLNTNINNN